VAAYPNNFSPIPLSSFGGRTIPFDINLAWSDVRRGGRIETVARGCAGFVSRTYRARFGFVATALGRVVAPSPGTVPWECDRAARFAALAAWYFALAIDSFDGSFVAEFFFEVFATD
jgi:hypothetical protein